MSLQETRMVDLVIPESPAPVATNKAPRAHDGSSAPRIGVLDNSKGNADHLLEMLTSDLQLELGAKVMVSLRKPHPSISATKEVLDQLAEEADFVFGAMAD